jgi:hypothetical protein
MTSPLSNYEPCHNFDTACAVAMKSDGEMKLWLEARNGRWIEGRERKYGDVKRIVLCCKSLSVGSHARCPSPPYQGGDVV